MKWLVKYSRFYCIGKGDAACDIKIIGYSDLDENELFEVLEKAYPNLPVLKEIPPEDKTRAWEYYYVDKHKSSVNVPYSDYVYFEENNLKEFK